MPQSPQAARPQTSTAIFAFAGMTASFMQTILIPIQGRLPDFLNAPASTTAWAITITLLTASIATPISGKLGDMFGKRRVALWLMGIVILSTLICALASNVALLILGRGLQGIGMGVIPLGIALLRDLLPREKLGSAVALVSATLGIGGALGLPISALVTLYFDWHVLFVLAGVLSMISFWLIQRCIPQDSNVSGGKVDLFGALGLGVLLTGLLLAISQGNRWGWASPATLSCLGLATVAALLWTRHELKAQNPLVDLRLATRGPVLMTNLSSIAMGFALFASSIAFPQLLQLPPELGGAGESLLIASVMLMPAGIAMLFISPISGRLQTLWGPRPLLILGATIITAAYLICALTALPGWKVSLMNLTIGVGIGFGYAAMPSLILRAVPREDTGSANAVNTLMRSLGTTLAAALVGAILAASAGTGQAESFRLIFLLGAGAAALCAALACLIPERR